MKYLLAFVFASIPLSAAAQQRPASWPPKISGEKHVYKTVGGRDICLWRIAADSSSGSKEPREQKAPAIIFFFGGGWTSGTPEQFLPQAKYLASRGMKAFVADYRVASRDKVTVAVCVEDAKSAIRWLRSNADKLAIDPNRICAAGGSAGGHIACATALLPGLEAKSDDLSFSCVPNALALFNPAVVLAPIDGLPTPKEAENRLEGLKSRLGAEPEAISPAHHVRSELPPAIILHGAADTTVKPVTVQKFSELMRAAGNRCELKIYPGAPHGFFNVPGNNGAAVKKKDANKKAEGQDQRSVWHRQTLRELDLFLLSLGWISGEPTIPETKTR